MNKFTSRLVNLEPLNRFADFMAVGFPLALVTGAIVDQRAPLWVALLAACAAVVVGAVVLHASRVDFYDHLLAKGSITPEQYRDLRHAMRRTR